MFDLILNAVKLATSKDARDSVGSLIAALKNSPEWKQDICTVEARVSVGDRERLHLIRDLALEKLNDLNYSTDSRRRFSFVFHELTLNAIEHGAQNSADAVVSTVVEVSPSYLSLSVHNPKGKGVDIQSWLQQSSDHLRETKMRGRGRGLILAYRKADRLEQDGDTGIKVTLFKDHVAFKTLDVANSTVVLVISGHSNPSLGRRLQEQFDNIDAEKLILCLHLRFLKEKQDRPKLAPDANELLTALSEEMDEDLDAYDSLDASTAVIWDTLALLHEWAKMRGSSPDATVRLVCGDADIQDLLPRDLVSRSVADALKALSAT